MPSGNKPLPEPMLTSSMSRMYGRVRRRNSLRVSFSDRLNADYPQHGWQVSTKCDHFSDVSNLGKARMGHPTFMGIPQTIKLSNISRTSYFKITICESGVVVCGKYQGKIR